MIEVPTRVTDAVTASRKMVGKITEQYTLRTTPLVLELDLTEPLVRGPRGDPVAAIVQRPYPAPGCAGGAGQSR